MGSLTWMRRKWWWRKDTISINFLSVDVGQDLLKAFLGPSCNVFSCFRFSKIKTKIKGNNNRSHWILFCWLERGTSRLPQKVIEIGSVSSLRASAIQGESQYWFARLQPLRYSKISSKSSEKLTASKVGFWKTSHASWNALAVDCLCYRTDK